MSLVPSFLLQWWRSIIDFLQGLMESGLMVSFTKTQISVKTIGKKNQSIGEGAFSTVYQAADQKQPNRRYALKRMLLQSLDLANMARNEVEAYNKFTHPHIIRLIDYAERVEDNKAVMYLLFPYHQRGSMRDELNLILSGAKKKPSLKGVVLKWFHSLCEAVQVLHDYAPSHVHFDIKPENVLVSDSGKAILTDLGSVRRADRVLNSRKDVLMVIDEAAEFCTASYRAPELFDPVKGMKLDCRTDVWALGCLLFALWFGYSPFECEFIGNTDDVKVVECSALRVLSDIPMPPTYHSNSDDAFVYDLAHVILKKPITDRMFVKDILTTLSMSTLPHSTAPSSLDFDPFSTNAANMV
eukprot:gene7469-8257_t